MWACFSADGIFSRVGPPLVYSVCGRSDIHTVYLAFIPRFRRKPCVRGPVLHERCKNMLLFATGGNRRHIRQ